MKILYIIPARGGSKGVPGKNVKSLGNKPLIWYSIDIAREFAKDEDICVSTDCDNIIQIVNERGLKVPFKRPDHLGLDTTSSYEVIIHAINYYEGLGLKYEAVILLQPTSPFRRKIFISEIIEQFVSNIDMVVSVKESDANPYFNLFEESPEGFLEKSKLSNFTRRQDTPKVYSYNGSIYMLKVDSLKNNSIDKFKRIKKYVMDDYHSIDIDTLVDWYLAELLLEKGLISYE